MVNNAEYEEILREDAEAIQNYVDAYYSLKVPPPQKPTKSDLSFWNIVGLEATLYSISAFGGAIVSSIRTGGLFYILEKLLMQKFNFDGIVSDLFGWTSLVASLAAFEIGILAWGFSQGKKMNDVKESRLGLFSAFVVIMAAGVFSGLGIVQIPETTEQIFNIILALITALGAGFVTLFGGHNIGYAINTFQNKKKEIEEEYQNRFNLWNEKAIKSYSSSHYSKQKLSKNTQNESGLSEIESNNQNGFQNTEKLSKPEKVVRYVEKFVEKNSKIPSTSEVVDASVRAGDSVSVGTAYAGITSYILQNAEKLLADGIISQERLDKLISKNEEQ